MGSGQSVPKDSPLACVLKNFKPLSLTELKANRLKQLCIQIWPQYRLGNQNCWPEFRTFNFNILSDLTNFLKWNGKGSEVPYAQAFWALQSRLPYAKAAPPMRSFYVPCLPNKRALLQLTAGHSLPHPQSLTQQTSPLPICQLSPSPSSNLSTDPQTSPDSP